MRQACGISHPSSSKTSTPALDAVPQIESAMSTTVWTQDLAQLNRKIVTVSFNEMVSRAYAEAPRKNGVHTRFTKDGVDDDASSSSVDAVS